MAALTPDLVLNVEIRPLCTVTFSSHTMLFCIVLIDGEPHSLQQVVITPDPDDPPPDELPLAAAA
jgi:hypothetical protein